MTQFQKQSADGSTRHLKHLKTHNPCVRIEKPKQSLRLGTVFWATAGEDHTWNMNHKMQLPLHMQEIFFPMKTAPGQPEKVHCCLICKPPSTLPLNNSQKTWCRLPSVLQENHGQNWSSLKNILCLRQEKIISTTHPEPVLLSASQLLDRGQSSRGSLLEVELLLQ